ncbi:SBBP repeat-containing protein, partial [Patescibacteria group bacterium]|nr:SBBP repeat-containing protein [Patescibacteria group bacterium]
PKGNIYVAGWTYGGLDGNTNQGDGDIFLIKYDSDGNRLWTKQAGTDNSDDGYGVAIDPKGNIYITGGTYGGLDGNTNHGSGDIFLIKYAEDDFPNLKEGNKEVNP